MIDEIINLHERYRSKVHDPLTASNLVLAHAMFGQQRSQHEIALTVAEVADRLKVSEKKVYQMVKAGEIPHQWIGNQIRVSPSTLENLIRKPRLLQN